MTTRTPIRAKAITAAVLLGGIALCAMPAHAQTEPVPVRPAKIETPGPARTWLAIMVAIGAGALAIGAAVMPSQRTHQD